MNKRFISMVQKKDHVVTVSRSSLTAVEIYRSHLQNLLSFAAFFKGQRGFQPQIKQRRACFVDPVRQLKEVLEKCNSVRPIREI